MSRWPVINVPIDGGLDTKTEDKMVAPPNLRDLLNVTFDKQGGKEKRHGHDRMPSETEDGTAITASDKLASVSDELVRFGGDKVYSWIEGLDRWTDKGNLPALTTSTRTASQVHAEQTNPSYAEVGGIGLICWDDSRGGGNIRYTLIDVTTGASILEDQLLPGSPGTNPIATATKNNLHVLYKVGSRIYCKTFLTGDIAGSASDISRVIIAKCDTTYDTFDVAVTDTYTYICWVSTEAAGTQALNIRVQSLTNAGELAGVEDGPKRAFFEEDSNGGGISQVANVAIHADEDLDKLLLCCEIEKAEGWEVAHAILTASELSDDTSSTEGLAEVEDLGTPGASTVLRIACALVDATYGSVWYEFTAADAWNHTVKQAFVDGADFLAADRGAIETWRHCSIAGGGLHVRGEAYVPLCADTPLQASILLIRSDQVIAARSIPGISNGNLATRIISKPIFAATDRFEFAAAYKIRLDAFDVDNYTEPGCKIITYDFSDDQALESVQAGKGLYVSGGHLWEYDGGEHPVEAGFFQWPEKVTAAKSTGGSMDAGDYTYRVEFQWPNSHGEIIRSFGLVVNVESVGATGQVTLTIPTLWATMKKGEFSRQEVAIVVYRTEKNPGEFSPLYRISNADPTQTTSPNNFVFNDPDSDTVTFVDQAADSTIVDDEPSYLNAEIGAFAPESGSVIGQGKDRIFTAGFEDGNIVEPSRLRFTGEQISFNDALRIGVDSAGGRITALAQLNDVLCVFKRDRIFAVPGLGPSNAQGDFASFGEAQQVPSDVGCLNQRTLALTPVGIFFQSAKGIRLLTPGLQVVYVGAPVELYNDQTITDAKAFTAKDEVRFLTASGRTLVFNWEQSKWSTWDILGVDATVWDDKYVYTKADGSTFRGNASIYTDGGNAYKISVTLPEISLGTKWGFQLVKSAILSLRYRGSHGIRVSVSYDGESFAQFAELSAEDVDNLVETSTWGEQPFWGDDQVWGGAGASHYVFECPLGRHKCALVSFKIEEIPAQVPTAAFSLMTLDIEAKGRSGRYPMRKAARFPEATGAGGGGGPGGGSGISPYRQYGPSSVYCPITSEEWKDLGIDTPTAWWQCQEESGDLKSSGNTGIKLVKNEGSGATAAQAYRQTVSGWERWFVKTIDGQKHRWESVDSRLDIGSGDSFSMLVYAAYTALTGSGNDRVLFGLGDYDTIWLLDSGDVPRVKVNGATAADGAQDHSGLTNVRPYLFVRDNDNDTTKLYTDLETVDATSYHTELAITDEKYIGVHKASDRCPTALYGFAAIWVGAALDETALEKLGWTLSY